MALVLEQSIIDNLESLVYDAESAFRSIMSIIAGFDIHPACYPCYIQGPALGDIPVIGEAEAARVVDDGLCGGSQLVLAFEEDAPRVEWIHALENRGFEVSSGFGYEADSNCAMLRGNTLIDLHLLTSGRRSCYRLGGDNHTVRLSMESLDYTVKLPVVPWELTKEPTEVRPIRSGNLKLLFLVQVSKSRSSIQPFRVRPSISDSFRF
ncbi:hypothetical protein PCASD_05427 [Puccinia coronata f. sp. avenae]|uniref:Uncharacterized protein n=1 Tax=Puccinia coronata f. sp. avenae TaxID=200324 RepID=A0A2N5UV50_9BASI|nr:hypothetical protein PCASD_05427 [Puccinia coronata f. sp. avenae]